MALWNLPHASCIIFNPSSRGIDLRLKETNCFLSSKWQCFCWLSPCCSLLSCNIFQGHPWIHAPLQVNYRQNVNTSITEFSFSLDCRLFTKSCYSQTCTTLQRACFLQPAPFCCHPPTSFLKQLRQAWMKQLACLFSRNFYWRSRSAWCHLWHCLQNG